MLTAQYLFSLVGDEGRWQDVMLSAGNIFFCLTLIPMLRQPERPPLLTCIPTGLALVVIRIRNAAVVAHCVEPDYNGTAVACSSFQKASQCRLVFH